MPLTLPTFLPEPSAGDAGASAPAVELRGVSVCFADHPVLRGLTLSFARGEHTAVLGVSGCGKSTLLATIAGRVAPCEGEVRRHSRRVATIHQDLRLVEQRSAIANVLDGAAGRWPLWRTLPRFPRVERRRAADLLATVGLTGRERCRVRDLSGGERQRVAVARALMTDPDLLLCDEPTASLDRRNARSVLALLDELCRNRGVTLISVLHDAPLAEAFADRIVALDAGQVVCDQRACAQRACAPPTGGCDARRDPTGLRGFTRFDPEALEADRAVDTPAAPSTMPPRHAAAPPAWRRATGAALLLLGAMALYGWCIRGLGIDARTFDGMGGNAVEFVGRLLPRSWAQLAAVDWAQLGRSMLVTLQMALLGTTAAAALSWPVAALAARGVAPWPVRSVCRGLLNVLRAVPSLVWALLAVAAFGLGEFAGLAALGVYSIGYLTKFYYEAFEHADDGRGPPSALREAGAGGVGAFLRAAWPAARPTVLASTIFMLEYNVRAASVLGLVGAGGIGFELKQHVEWRNFHVVGAILVVLAVVVIALDALSRRIRARLLS